MSTVEPASAGWRIAGRVLIALGGLCAVAVAVRLVMRIVVRGEGRADVGGRLVTLAGGLVVLALLATYLVWFYASRGHAERHGADGRRIVRHWTLTLWRITFVGSIVLTYLPFEQAARSQPAFAALRLVSLAFLVAGVVVVQRRLSGLVDGTYQPVGPTPEQAYWSRRPPEDPFEEHWTDYRNPVP